MSFHETLKLVMSDPPGWRSLFHLDRCRFSLLRGGWHRVLAPHERLVGIMLPRWRQFNARNHVPGRNIAADV
jgi:hypothetical protein